ncbi:MAG: hypothetical protein HY784_10345 [Chloroflexi bacterium]|nr:hypothetical protein [Chloroflexota bacterium]
MNSLNHTQWMDDLGQLIRQTLRITAPGSRPSPEARARLLARAARQRVHRPVPWRTDLEWARGLGLDFRSGSTVPWFTVSTLLAMRTAQITWTMHRVPVA